MELETVRYGNREKNMKHKMYLAMMSISVALAVWAANAMAAEEGLHGFSMKGIDGRDIPLSRFRGEVILVVNTASKCGLTPQYEALQALYRKYRARDFVILGFPANNFLQQEPGTDRQIKQFCSVNYGVTFPLFSKISVKGDDIHPLYQYLTGKETNPDFAGDI